MITARLLVGVVSVIPLLAIADPVHANDGATDLVRVMQLDRSVLMGLQGSFRDGAAAGKVGQTQYECIKAIKPSALTETYAQIARLTLTPQEISDAYAFYSGPVGEKVTEFAFKKFEATSGAHTPAPAPELSEADKRVMETFLKTSAGKRIITEQAFQSPAATPLIQQKLSSVIAGCR